jgi:hypothetical protein
MITLRDTQTIQRNDINAVSWDKIVEGKTNYIVKGYIPIDKTAGL